jgi:hypothetical protein
MLSRLPTSRLLRPRSAQLARKSTRLWLAVNLALWCGCPLLAIIFYHQQVHRLWLRVIEVQAQAPGSKTNLKRNVYFKDDEDNVQLRMKVWERMGFSFSYMETWFCPHCLHRGGFRAQLDDHMAKHMSEDGVRPEDLGMPGMTLSHLRRLGRLHKSEDSESGSDERVERLQRDVKALQQKLKQQELRQRAGALFERVTAPPPSPPSPMR